MAAAKALCLDTASRRWLLVGLQGTRAQPHQLHTAAHRVCAGGTHQGSGGLETWVTERHFVSGGGMLSVLATAVPRGSLL